MLQLNTNKKKVLEFSVNIQGVDYKDLEGSLKFTVDDVHYGFPLEIVSDNIIAEIPPLEDIVKGLKDKDIVECKLEVYGDGFYMNPWKGDFQLVRPVKVEADLQEESEYEGKVITATLVEKNCKTKKKESPKKEVSETDRKEVLNTLFKKAEGYKSVQKTPTRKNISEVTQKKINKMNDLVDSFFSTPKPSKIKTESVRPKPTQVKNNQDIINDPIALMESYGLKNKNVQERLLETIGHNEPDEICRQLKKMLGKSDESSINLYSQLQG